MNSIEIILSYLPHRSVAEYIFSDRSYERRVVRISTIYVCISFFTFRLRLTSRVYSRKTILRILLKSRLSTRGTRLCEFYLGTRVTLALTQSCCGTRARASADFTAVGGAARRKRLVSRIVNVTGSTAGRDAESLVSCKIGIHRGRKTIQSLSLSRGN